MTTDCGNTDQRAAGWAKFGAWLIIFAAAAEQTANGIFPAIDALLPLIG
jgi:hypothetical protein